MVTDHHPWERKITNTFPQDSILALVLSNVFASNLVTKAKSALLKFGDHIKLRSAIDTEKMQNKLDDVSNWSTKSKSGNGMKYKSTKMQS